jgi:hypothetical protein
MRPHPQSQSEFAARVQSPVSPPFDGMAAASKGSAPGNWAFPVLALQEFLAIELVDRKPDEMQWPTRQTLLLILAVCVPFWGMVIFYFA